MLCKKYEVVHKNNTSTGQKGELIQVLIATSQIYAPSYDDHKTWDYKKIYSEIIGYMFSIIVEKSVTGYCWKLSYEEWTLLTWFKSILWAVLECPSGIRDNTFLQMSHKLKISIWAYQQKKPPTDEFAQI